MENNLGHKYQKVSMRASNQDNPRKILSINNNMPHFSVLTEGHHFGKFLSCLVLFFACLHTVVSGSSDEISSLMIQCKEKLPECECDVYFDVGGLNCKNVSNFERFAQTLSDGSLFEVNTTFEISLSGSRVLPREFLNGLIIYRLMVEDAQMENVEDGAFEKVLKLRRFYVKLSSIQVIPDFRPVQGSLQSLNLENSLLTSISGDRLKNLSNLETVSFVNNSIRYVSPDAFQGTDNLLIIDLSHNQLRTLPPSLFNPWRRLKKVTLSSNQLLHVNQLFASTHPQFIYLDHNNLTDLDSILHRGMHAVETLQLSHNLISTVTENSFNGKINNTRFLYLDHCLIREFNARYFQDLSKLQTLDLSYNLIEEVANQSISFGRNTEIDFTANNIQEFRVNFTKEVRRLNLGKNLLTSVGQTLQYNQIVTVDMAENRIETLGPDDFRNVHGIRSIELQGNQISKVHPRTFWRFNSDLLYLDVSRNQIHSLQGCVRYLFVLLSLNLTDNRIESFEEDEFQGLTELKDLYLAGNLITTLGNAMLNLNSLDSLFLSNNRISTFKPEQMPQKLKYLYLEGNPIKCDCQLLPFLQYLDSSSLKTDGPICASSNQTSLPPSAECPDGCNCSCMHKDGDPFVSVDCSSAGLTELPRLFTNEYSSRENSTSMAVHIPLNIHFPQAGPIIIADDIGSLNLTDNHLQTLEGAHLPDRLRQLFLRKNNLQKPPASQLFPLTNLKEVTLSGNPWSCDCDSLSSKEWVLSSSEILIDANDTRCGPQYPELAGRLISSLTNLDVCPESTEPPTSLTI